MAAVLRARDTQLDRFVALKILPPEMAQDPENVRRFHQEARSAAKLDHENIARVFFCGEDQRLHFIAFEFVEGENLRTLIERRGRLPLADVRSDLYSLGCTFYHMVTGQPPVPDGTAAKKLHHHQQVRPLDPRALAPDLPDGAAVVIGRLIAKRPADRYQSAEELVHHLLL